ncbi:MAG: hypothetical protein GYB35_17025 [Algicola sp.]|nr:hypothetical protein [Algicola sp.]
MKALENKAEEKFSRLYSSRANQLNARIADKKGELNHANEQLGKLKKYYKDYQNQINEHLDSFSKRKHSETVSKKINVLKTKIACFKEIVAISTEQLNDLQIQKATESVETKLIRLDKSQKINHISKIEFFEFEDKLDLESLTKQLERFDSEETPELILEQLKQIREERNNFYEK